MKGKLKSALLSFEAIILYVVIGLIIVFGITMCVLLSHHDKHNKEDANNKQNITTELKEETTENNSVESTKTTEEEIKEKGNKEDVKPVKSTKENKKTTEVEKTTESSEIKNEEHTVEEPPELISLGEFRLTAYCKCSKCCGKWSNSPTASGVEPRVNHTIAVDTSVIPFGTKVIIDGKTYTAEDTGSAIKGNRIDIYMESHSKAMDFGVQYAEVFVVNH